MLRCVLIAFFALFGLSANALTVVLEMPPRSLNPRQTVDVNGQRLVALLFSGLTRIDHKLELQSDLAKTWSSSSDGKTWHFEISDGQRDHLGIPITAEDLKICLENYRTGKPASPLKGAFPDWIKTTTKKNRLSIHLKNPDWFLANNISALKFFRQKNLPPCSEPDGKLPVFTSGIYREGDMGLSHLFPQKELKLTPLDPNLSPLHFVFVRDELTRMFMLLRGDADAAQNVITLTKTRWLQNKHAKNFNVIETDGTSVEYLAFNLSDPLLSNIKIRQAIAHAINRDLYVKHKMIGFGKIINTFLPPQLKEHIELDFDFNPQKSIRLLREANLSDLSFSYICTPVREGIEKAKHLQTMLAAVGIKLRVETLEPAVYFERLRKGNYQLYSTRWVGVADVSILNTALNSTSRLNRVYYANPQVDQWLSLAQNEPHPEKRLRYYQNIQKQMLVDLPYFPLWIWNNSLILSKKWESLSSDDLSARADYYPLSTIRLKKQWNDF